MVETADEFQPRGIVVLEQTHRSAGGRVWPLDELTEVTDTARELGLAVHLDGARLINASVASWDPGRRVRTARRHGPDLLLEGARLPDGRDPRRLRRSGSSEAWPLKFLFGGALRQAGVVAAAMLYALDHNVERLADDHARARRLAAALAGAGLPVDVDSTETNFIGIDVASVGFEAAEARARIAEQGVLVGLLRPGVLRVALHLGVTDEDVDRAGELIPRALAPVAA